MSLFGLLVTLLVLCLVFWAIRRILAATGVGEPITTIVYVVFVLIVCFYLLSAFGLVPALRVT